MNEILDRLHSSVPITQAAGSLPNQPGLYAWWITEPHILSELTLTPAKNGLSLLYVGIAKDSLRSRVLGKHIKGTLGNSTLRRSLASLLLQRNSWVPCWPSDRVMLSKEHNDSLSQWMDRYLRVAWVPVVDPDQVEAKVIAALQPPLNLAHNAKHQSYRQVRDARANLERVARPVESQSLHEVDALAALAKWIWMRNQADATISRIIGRPAEKGHIGEFIASQLFAVDLHDSATRAGSDGQFTSGTLTGSSVNIKYYGKMECMLDINPLALPDYYLCFTGPAAGALSSRFGVRPFAIDNIFLFEAAGILERCSSRGVKVGNATSLPRAEWTAAELYPDRNSSFAEELVTPEVLELLQPFGTAKIVT